MKIFVRTFGNFLNECSGIFSTNVWFFSDSYKGFKRIMRHDGMVFFRLISTKVWKFSDSYILTFRRNNTSWDIHKSKALFSHGSVGSRIVPHVFFPINEAKRSQFIHCRMYNFCSVPVGL